MAQANKVSEETISAMKTVRSFATEELEADTYYQKLQEMFVLNKKQAFAYSCFMWSSCVRTTFTIWEGGWIDCRVTSPKLFGLSVMIMASRP